MLNEGRKIMHLPELRVNCTCVRVPVVRSHSESITAEFERPLSVEEASAALEAAPGVRVVDEPAASRYPMPLETSDQDLVYVGRIRRDLSAPEGVSALTSGAAATRSARARRPTPCRSRSTWSSRRGGARRTGGPGSAVLLAPPRLGRRVSGPAARTPCDWVASLMPLGVR